MVSVDELCSYMFYGNMQPTWITRTAEDRIHAGYPYSRYMVPVVELRVSQCCNTDCERKIMNCLYKVHGVDQVIVDYHNQKVTVTGNASEKKILRAIKKVKKRATLYARKQVGQI